MKLLALTMTLAIVVVPRASQVRPQTTGWKTFTNRAGWSIQYPAKWKKGSCHFCPDPAEGTAYVTFRDPERSADFVMVEHLAPIPANETVDDWLHKMSQGNSNPVTSEETLLLDGLPALKVRNRHRLGWEFETVYVIRDSETFSIGINDQNAGERIQDMSIYPIYLQMVSTFRFTR